MKAEETNTPPEGAAQADGTVIGYQVSFTPGYWVNQLIPLGSDLDSLREAGFEVAPVIQQPPPTS